VIDEVINDSLQHEVHNDIFGIDAFYIH